MRLTVSALLVASALLSSASASIFSTPPKVESTAAFPPSNPFGRVVNGEKNRIDVLVENKSDNEITLKSVSGSWHIPESGRFIRNTTTLTYNSALQPGSKITIPYTIHSEFKPADTRLRLFVDYTSSGEKHRLQAFDSVVSVVEAAGSWFDPVLILTYLLSLGILGGGGYLAYNLYFPAPKNATRRKTTPTPSEPVGSVTATTTSGYSEEWIPEHHLKSRKSSTRKANGLTSDSALSSGDEGVVEKKKGKGKKRN